MPGRTPTLRRLHRSVVLLIVACWAFLVAAAGISGGWWGIGQREVTLGVGGIAAGSIAAIGLATVLAVAERPGALRMAATWCLAIPTTTAWILVAWFTGLGGGCCEPRLADPLTILYSWPEALGALSALSIATAAPLRVPSAPFAGRPA